MRARSASISRTKACVDAKGSKRSRKIGVECTRHSRCSVTIERTKAIRQVGVRLPPAGGPRSTLMQVDQIVETLGTREPPASASGGYRPAGPCDLASVRICRRRAGWLERRPGCSYSAAWLESRHRPRWWRATPPAASAEPSPSRPSGGGPPRILRSRAREKATDSRWFPGSRSGSGTAPVIRRPAALAQRDQMGHDACSGCSTIVATSTAAR